MEHLLIEVDEMLQLLNAHCGSRAELEGSRLAAFRSKLSCMDAELPGAALEQLRTELIILTHSSKALQFASLAMNYATSIRGCVFALKQYEQIAAVRKLNEREQQDYDALPALLRESQDRFDRTVEELRNLDPFDTPGTMS